MPEPILLALGLLVAGAVVLAPLWRRPPAALRDETRDGAEVRHRVALETLRDVEADRRAGSLDEAAYAEQLAEAEARAAATADCPGGRSAHRSSPGDGSRRPHRRHRDGRVLAVVLVGARCCPPAGVANSDRRERGAGCRRGRRGGPPGPDRGRCWPGSWSNARTTPTALSELADAYLAGSTAGGPASSPLRLLQVLIRSSPERADAYERVVGAYLRAATS